jgi:hypothetical protein
VSNLLLNPYRAARDKGLSVVKPSKHELFIDIDNDEDLAHYEAMCDVMDSALLPVHEVRRTRSSGGNWHIVAKTAQELTPIERIALQAALGSDRKRELLSILRIWREPGVPPTVFFEKTEVS